MKVPYDGKFELAVTFQGDLWLVHQDTDRELVKILTDRAMANPPIGPVLPDLNLAFIPVILDFEGKDPADIMEKIDDGENIEVYKLPYFEECGTHLQGYTLKGIKVIKDAEITLMHKPA